MIDSLSNFATPVADWFRSELGEPTPVQERGWPKLSDGHSTLLLSPTGSGKTLAAFLVGLNRLMFGEQASAGVRLLYISPLKALAVDVERNLRLPLAGIEQAAIRLGVAFDIPSIALRSGDTPAIERARFRRKPTDILITTPESLYLLLTSDASRHLASVETVIIDEIHSMLSTKRGAHLSLSLERLERLRRGKPLQRIGLSATVRPIEEAAAFLGGGQVGVDGRLEPRAVEIVDTAQTPNLRLVIEVPVQDMDRSGLPGAERSIWPAIHAPLVELIRQHQSTLIFVNSRGLCERLSASLNELSGEALVLAHHGAVARERRLEIESSLKSGRLRGLVATSTLELGIDMGAIDLVVQIEAPPSVASGLQRIGRAGHHVSGTSLGIIFPKFRGDLLAAAATSTEMQLGAVEAQYYPRNPLDVLAQQIVAIVSDGEIHKQELLSIVRRAAPFFDLSESTFASLLDLLSGRYPSDEFAELKPRIIWDRANGLITARQGARRIAIVNGGTIPDRGLYGVFLAGDPGKRSRRVGELDEEMVFESRVGDVFLLGASSWRIEDITYDRVLVNPAPGEPGRMPFWHGDRAGRPLALGRAVGKLARTLSTSNADEALSDLQARGLTPLAAKNLITYLSDQRQCTGAIPSDENIIVESFLDELGDHRVCVLSPFGSRVHAPWAIAAMETQRRTWGIETEAVWSDDGIVFRFPEARPATLSAVIPEEIDLDELLQQGLAKSPLFATYFRENAARALLLPRRRPGQRTPLWAQRRRAADLLRAASRFPDFPILLETFRECLRDVFDVPGLRELLAAVRRREVRVSQVESRTASPFAASLLFSYVGNFIYDGDAPLAERRAHALTIDQAQLRELLGETELRHLLDSEAISEIEREAGRANVRLRHADDLHDLLIAIGDLDLSEITGRSDNSVNVEAWLSQLKGQGRVVELTIRGRERYAAVEDMSRFRDSIGIVAPAGIPAEFLSPLRDPLGDIVSRFARTHGPFTQEALTLRYPLSESQVTLALQNLERVGRLIRGKFLPAGKGIEWCDSEVLRRIKQRSLARLRNQVEAVSHAVYARFLVEWQGVAQPRAGYDVLSSAIDQLQGAPLVASVLDRELMPARVHGYHPADLDELTNSGEFIWRGLESLGAADGRIALYRAENYAHLAPASSPVPGELADKIRQLLFQGGASFFAELVAGTRALPNELLDTLWSLVWSGEVTNDSLAPLRSRIWASSGRRPERRPGRRPANNPRLAGSEGRWSLLARWLPSPAPSPTARLARMVDVLLDRYGVLPREMLSTESFAPFSELYPLLKALEEAGKLRRGYFVKDLAATQFAQAGAEDRLRLLREESRLAAPVTLAATDPANPYGAALPWPEGESRPQRAAGARVIILDGALIGYISRSAHSILTFFPSPREECRLCEEALATALKRLIDGHAHRSLVIDEIDGRPPATSNFGRALEQLGFVATSNGYIYRAAQEA